MPQYNAEILNQPGEHFLNTARNIGFQAADLRGYAEEMEAGHNGLYRHAGAWVDMIERQFSQLGPGFVELAKTGFDNGVLLTYGILKTVSEETGVTIQDIDFDPNNFVDSDPPEPRDPKNMSILTLSRRGVCLPERFPAIYETGVIVTSRIFKQPPKVVRHTVTKPGIRPSPGSIGIANYLAGSAEVVLPLERYAEVANLERGLKPKGQD